MSVKYCENCKHHYFKNLWHELFHELCCDLNNKYVGVDIQKKVAKLCTCFERKKS